ncbi:MAG TPA: hypothetical protein PK074_11530 [Spirochaetales bacterium]|nr:hypothetical protein [Spirochaetales bacterium]
MELVVRGRRMLIIIMSALLLVDISTTIVVSYLYTRYGYTSQALSGLITGVVRLAITALILFFLYKGHRWAKWLIIVLMFFAGLFSLFALPSFLAKSLGVLCIVSGIVLIASKSINGFLQYQRSKKENIVDDHKQDTDNN